MYPSLFNSPPISFPKLMLSRMLFALITILINQPQNQYQKVNSMVLKMLARKNNQGPETPPLKSRGTTTKSMFSRVTAAAARNGHLFLKERTPHLLLCSDGLDYNPIDCGKKQIA